MCHRNPAMDYQPEYFGGEGEPINSRLVQTGDCVGEVVLQCDYHLFADQITGKGISDYIFKFPSAEQVGHFDAVFPAGKLNHDRHEQNDR